MGLMAAEASVEAHTRVRRRAPDRPWRVDDLRDLPDDGMRYEIIDGVLLVSPAPNRRHQTVSGRLFSALLAVCPPDLAVFYAPLAWQPGPDRSFEPDLLVVPAGSVDDPIPRPSLVVEILSPSTAHVDRTLKFSAYAEAGVPQYWIVNPGNGSGDDTTVEVYDLAGGIYRLQSRVTGSDALSVTGPVPVRLVPAELVR